MAIHINPLAYLTTTKIGEKGQLTVPKQFREDLGLENGAPFVVLRMGNGLILLPEQRRFESLCQRISSRLCGDSVAPEAVIATLPETRKRVYERRYGKSVAKRRARRT